MVSNTSCSTNKNKDLNLYNHAKYLFEAIRQSGL